MIRILQCFFVFSLFLTLGTVESYSQHSVVKDAERILASSKPDYAAALKAITPALDDSVTKSNPETWIIASKAMMGIWDKMLLNIQIGTDVKVADKKNAANGLVKAYDYLLIADSLDRLPDSKGKVKQRYAKDLSKLFEKAYKGYRNAGIFLFDLKDYAGAYSAWEAYLTSPSVLARYKKSVSDEGAKEIARINYYQGVSAAKLGKYSDALIKLQYAEKAGYNAKELYLFGIEAARRLGQDSIMICLAEAGHKLYGNQECGFALLLINNALGIGDFPRCASLATEALATNPDDRVKSQLYDVLGIVYDHNGKFEDALDSFQKAVVYDSESAKAYFDLARIIYNEALRIAESDKEDAEAIAAPGFEKAAEYFEKAYSMDSSFKQIPSTLYAIYYRLGVGFETKAAYWEKLQ